MRERISNRQAFTRILELIFHRPVEFLLASGLVIVLAFVELPMPIFMAVLVDQVIPSGDVGAAIAVGIFLCAIRASASFFQVFQNYLIAGMTIRFSSILRKSMLFKMLRLPYTRYLNGDANGMVTRLVTDMERVEGFAQETISFMIRPLMSAALMLFVMFWWNLPLALYSITIVPAVTLASRTLRSKLEDSARRQRQYTELLEVDAAEAFSNIRNVKAYGAQDLMAERINSRIEVVATNAVNFKVFSQISHEIITLLQALNDIGFIAFASYQVFAGDLSIGGFVALRAMAGGIRSPIAQIMYYLVTMKSKAVALERVDKVIDEPTEHDGRHTTSFNSSLQGAVKFENVSLHYDNKEPVLKDVNLDIRPGEFVALVGPSGAGKTSLAHLLMGLFIPSGGRICIDGQDLRHLDLEALRQHYGVVYQEPILFNNTVRYNMLIGHPEADDATIWEALKKANAWDFIHALPKGLDAVIGVNGIKLSGGQKQRLAIARAILPNPKIMILDEATSSLDSTSEREIQTALDQTLKNRTSLVIAHRLSTILNADRIVVLEAGKIVAEGTHADLLRDDSGLYHRLYTTQTHGMIGVS